MESYQRTTLMSTFPALPVPSPPPQLLQQSPDAPSPSVSSDTSKDRKDSFVKIRWDNCTSPYLSKQNPRVVKELQQLVNQGREGCKPNQLDACIDAVAKARHAVAQKPKYFEEPPELRQQAPQQAPRKAQLEPHALLSPSQPATDSESATSSYSTAKKRGRPLKQQQDQQKKQRLSTHPPTTPMPLIQGEGTGPTRKAVSTGRSSTLAHDITVDESEYHSTTSRVRFLDLQSTDDTAPSSQESTNEALSGPEQSASEPELGHPLPQTPTSPPPPIHSLCSSPRKRRSSARISKSEPEHAPEPPSKPRKSSGHRSPPLNQSTSKHPTQRAKWNGKRKAENKYRQAKNGLFGNRRTPQTPTQEQQLRDYINGWEDAQKGKRAEGQAIDYNKGWKDSHHAANLAREHAAAELAPAAADHFDLLWPSISRPDISRLCIFVRRSLSKQLVHYIQHALSIYVSEGEPNFFIHNVYNPPGVIENYGIRDLREAIQKADNVPGQITTSSSGTLSLPHEASSPRPSRAGIGGSPGTTLDLTLSSWELQEQLRHVRVVEISGLSDHLPIASEFNTLLTTKETTPKRNWKELDADKLRSTSIDNQWAANAIDTTALQLVEAIHTAIDASTPWSKPTTLSRPGFTKECRLLQKEAHQAQKQILRFQETHNRPAPEPMLRAFRHKKAVARKRIKRYMNQAHQTRSRRPQSQALRDRPGTSRGGQGIGPPIRPSHRLSMERTGHLRFRPEQKAALLTEAFFPSPRTASIVDIDGFSYPEPVLVPLITATEVQRAIHLPGTFKAAEPDDIPNRVLQAAAPTDQHTLDPLSPMLANLFNSCLSIGYCSQHFRDSKTVTLRKPGKDDYSKPKSYRPIALLNTIGKALEGVLALRLSYLAEEHNLLPRNHFGGRKGQGTDTALHAVGSPLSPILYLFYNADLMGDKQYTSNFGYVDDTIMIAVGNSEAENCRSLQKSFRECDTWAKTHASVFAPDKFALVHFPHQNHYQESQNDNSSTTEGSASPQGSSADVNLGNGRNIRHSASAKLLGVLLESRLSFKDLYSKSTRNAARGCSQSGRSAGPNGASASNKIDSSTTPVSPSKPFHSISGAFRRVSGTAHNAQLYLQPMAHRLRESRFRAVTCIATSKVYKTIRDRRSHHRKQAMQTALETAEEELLS
ncbi:hypothetical protein NUU61_001349 [Penicillium alfredii]|uniref:Reverse transcriptase domain-containing protein n=1 Tax=Penicillium alfredii TaxID=1506179 RepID=A0A9W9KM04_9EURO|nr:uncharacterized protein NUU61_001349 [Penicillium alfredii]KAJ5111719.1 hypothetical protein NUU61_001349 [Penicillium alfredii]